MENCYNSFKTKYIFSISRPLELLHIDLFVLVDTASINEKKYALVIVDDYNRRTWVKFLRPTDSWPTDGHNSFLRRSHNTIGFITARNNVPWQRHLSSYHSTIISCLRCLYKRGTSAMPGTQSLYANS